MQAEADTAQKALDQEIAKARAADAKSLPGFAGIRFGNVMDGDVISLERLPDYEKHGDEGLCCQMFEPKLAKAFNRFGTQPMVYVTPKTPKAFFGIVFGSLPPYSARIISPPSSTAPHCFYVGSLEITLGPDPQSGFFLKAVNTTLKEAW